MLRRKREVFAPADGPLILMAETARSQARGVDFSTTEGLDPRLRLDFRSMRLRSQDVELAAATGSELTRRVQVRDAPGIATEQLALVQGTVYEVTRVDRSQRTAYLWLAEVACDGTCELLSDDVVTDGWAVERPEPKGTTVHVRRAADGMARESTPGADVLQPTTSLRLRACDYDGELELRRLGLTYAVVGVTGHGRWVDLRCELREGTRGDQ